MARKRAITAACGPRGARANLTKGRLGFPLQVDATRAITVERLVANQNLSELIAWANFLKPTLQASFEGDGEGPPDNVDFLAEVIIHALPSAWRDHVAAMGTDDAFPSPKCSGCHEFQPSSLPETCTCGEEFAFSIEEREEDLVCEGCNTPATFAGQRFCMKCKDVKAMVPVSSLKDSTPTCPWRASQAFEFWCLQGRYVFKFVTGTKVVADADAAAVADADADTSNDASTYILTPPVAF